MAERVFIVRDSILLTGELMLICSLVLGHESVRRFEVCVNDADLTNWFDRERDRANERFVEVKNRRRGDSEPRTQSRGGLPILLCSLCRVGNKHLALGTMARVR